MAFNNVRFDHGFQIHLVPVLRDLLEHRIQVLGIRHDLAGCFGPCSQDACQHDDRLPGHFVVNSGDDRIILRKLGMGNLPPEGPRSFWVTLTINGLRFRLLSYSNPNGSSCVTRIVQMLSYAPMRTKGPSRNCVNSVLDAATTRNEPFRGTSGTIERARVITSETSKPPYSGVPGARSRSLSVESRGSPRQ